MQELVNSDHWVQARLVRSNLRLKDGGAKVVTRIAQLRTKIAGLEKGAPQSVPGLRQPSSMSSRMIPVSNGVGKVREPIATLTRS